MLIISKPDQPIPSPPGDGPVGDDDYDDENGKEKKVIIENALVSIIFRVVARTVSGGGDGGEGGGSWCKDSIAVGRISNERRAIVISGCGKGWWMLELGVCLRRLNCEQKDG